MKENEIMSLEKDEEKETSEQKDVLEELEELKKIYRKAYKNLDFDYEDLDEFGKAVSNIIGIENYKKMSKYCAGGNHYWPQYSKLIERKKKAFVYNLFLKFGYQKTAILLGISESTVRRYVKYQKRLLRKKQKEKKEI